MSEQKEIKELKIAWPMDTGPAAFVNNVVIQRDPSGMAYLTFFQVVPPNTIAMEQSDIEKMDRIEAKQVVKIVVTKEQLRSISDLLVKHLGDFDE